MHYILQVTAYKHRLAYLWVHSATNVPSYLKHTHTHTHCTSYCCLIIILSCTAEKVPKWIWCLEVLADQYMRGRVQDAHTQDMQSKEQKGLIRGTYVGMCRGELHIFITALQQCPSDLIVTSTPASKWEKLQRNIWKRRFEEMKRKQLGKNA